MFAVLQHIGIGDRMNQRISSANQGLKAYAKAYADVTGLWVGDSQYKVSAYTDDMLFTLTNSQSASLIC